jgi:hypothetical protein
MLLSYASPPAIPKEPVDTSRYAAMVDTLVAHPAMPQALRSLCEGLGGLFSSSRMLNLIAGDRGRLAIGWMTLYLDAEREPGNPGSGLTVNRFKVLCASTGLCSPGRAGAMLGVMRFAGYLEPAAHSTRGMPLQLIPTARFLAQQRLRCDKLFDALRHVATEGGDGLALMHHADFPRDFVRGAGDLFLAGARPVLQAPSLLVFARKKAGFQVLLSLILSGQHEDAMPPEGTVSLRIAECAKRFMVSRPQVKDVLEEAVAAGLLQPTGMGAHSYVMSAALRQDCLRFAAAALALAAVGVRAAAAAVSNRTSGPILGKHDA